MENYEHTVGFIITIAVAAAITSILIASSALAVGAAALAGVGVALSVYRIYDERKATAQTRLQYEEQKIKEAEQRLYKENETKRTGSDGQAAFEKHKEPQLVRQAESRSE